VTDFEHKCSHVCRIHNSFACNQQLAYFRVTTRGSAMQSGELATRTENQMHTSKTKHNTKSAASLQGECLHVCRIHVRFACNQQLAHFRVTNKGSVMQSGASFTSTETHKPGFKKQNATQNQ
jgi:hypothetical protein